MAFTQIPVTATYLLADGSAPTGEVRFTPSTTMRNLESGSTAIVPPEPVTAVVDDDGVISIDLAATDDPDTTPVGVTYLVEELFKLDSLGQLIKYRPTASYRLKVPFSGGSIDLSRIFTTEGASSLGGLVATATGLKTVIGAAAAAFGALTSSASGGRLVTGTGSATLGSLTATAAGAVVEAGTAAAPLGALTSTAVGWPTFELQQTVVDAFDDGTIDTGLWSDWGSPNTAETGGVLRLSVTDGVYAGLTTNATVDLNEKVVGSQLIDAGNQAGIASLEVYPADISVDGDNEAFWLITGESVIASKKVATVFTNVAQFAYDPAVHRYFAIGVVGGQIVWVWSTDATTWFVAYAESNPFGTTDFSVVLLAGIWDTGTDTVDLDDYSSWAEAATVTGDASAPLGALTSTAAGVRTAAGTAAATLGTLSSTSSGTVTAGVVAVVVRSAAGASGAEAGDAAVVTKPAGLAVGDLLIGISVGDNDGTLANLTGPAAFGTAIGSQAAAGGQNPGVKVWSLVATSTEVAASNFSFSAGTGVYCSAGLIAIEAGTFDSADPIHLGPTFNAQTTNSTTHTAPSLASGVVEGLLITGHATDQAGAATCSYTKPSGMDTEQVDTSAADGFSALEICTKALSSTSATGTQGATCTVNRPSASVSLVINPGT